MGKIDEQCFYKSSKHQRQCWRVNCWVTVFQTLAVALSMEPFVPITDTCRTSAGMKRTGKAASGREKRNAYLFDDFPVAANVRLVLESLLYQR